MLGVNWALARAGIDEVVLGLNKRSINLSPATTVDIALDNKKLVAQQLDEIKPDFVVHAAAITSVEACENNPETAYAINAGYAGLMAACAVRRILGFCRSQQIISLMAASRYSMSRHQLAHSTLMAGESLAENLVLEAHPSALIVRVNFFCWGPEYRSSFSDWIVNAPQNGSPVTLYDNVFFTPLTPDKSLISVISLSMAGQPGFTIFHQATGSANLISGCDWRASLI